MSIFSSQISRGHAALRGVIATTLGVVCVIWPGITVGVVVLLFAVYCFSDALTRVASQFTSGESAGRRVLMGLMVLVDVAAGLVAIFYPGISAVALVVVIGVWAIIGGVTETAAAWSWPGNGSGWLAFGGVLSVAAGTLLIAWPGIGAYSLALVFGIYLISYGVTWLVNAIQMRAGASLDAASA
jgi:uncharacterized membrane protein HdeD (DUF308 family)